MGWIGAKVRGAAFSDRQTSLGSPRRHCTRPSFSPAVQGSGELREKASQASCVARHPLPSVFGIQSE